MLAMSVVRKFLKREESSVELNLTCLPIFIKSYSQNSKSRMVRPGNKTKIVCLAAAVIAEYLKYRGIIPFGAEMIYGVARPAWDDLIGWIEEEDYHRMMATCQRAKRMTIRWLVNIYTYTRNRLGL